MSVVCVYACRDKRHVRLAKWLTGMFSVLFGIGAIVGVIVVCARRGEGGASVVPGVAMSAPPVTETLASGFRTMKIGSAVQMVMGSE